MAAFARAKAQFICQNCGAVSPRWQGRCEDCGEWNTLVEEAGAERRRRGPRRSARKGRIITLEGLAGDTDEAPRTKTGIAEFDRVTGGGFVRGSALLVGGDPGIGKSTLLLQVGRRAGRAGQPVVYISGEEAIAQIRLRAERLGLADAPVEARRRDERRGHPGDAGRGGTARRWSSSIRSRRCGPTSPTPLPARSPRSARRRRR